MRDCYETRSVIIALFTYYVAYIFRTMRLPKKVLTIFEGKTLFVDVFLCLRQSFRPCGCREKSHVLPYPVGAGGC